MINPLPREFQCSTWADNSRVISPMSMSQTSLTSWVTYPNPDDCILKFQAHKKQFRLPFYLVCDFESFLSPADDDDDEHYNRPTRLIDEHRVCGFACHRVTDIVEYQTDPVDYSGPDPMSVFYDHVMTESKIIGEIL